MVAGWCTIKNIHVYVSSSMRRVEEVKWEQSSIQPIAHLEGEKISGRGDNWPVITEKERNSIADR